MDAGSCGVRIQGRRIQERLRRVYDVRESKTNVCDERACVHA